MNPRELFAEAVSRALRRKNIEDFPPPEAVAPPKTELGDLAIACFPFARAAGSSPAQIAADLAVELSRAENWGRFRAVGPYLNVRLASQTLFGGACRPIRPRPARGEKLLIEYLSPNTNKPLHLGHLRNGLLASAVANLAEFAGFEVIRVNLLNDRGIHICRSMAAWLKFGSGKTPETEKKKGDHFVGDYYVLFARKAAEDPSLEEYAREILRKWEAGDEEIREVWRKMDTWVTEGFAQTCELFGFRFDRVYRESDLYEEGKEMVKRAREEGLLRENEKGLYLELPTESFGRGPDGRARKALLLRADGTSLYITQDLAAARAKYEDYAPDRSIYVVADEQRQYFKTLFYVFEKLDFPWADRCEHLSYGMVTLPEGRMKSRQGNVVDADDLLRQVEETAARQISASEESAEKAAARARKIALAAIKFGFLKVGPQREMLFDPKKEISFEGDTGPYIQYAYTRVRSILRKAAERGIDPEEETFKHLGKEEKERVLARELLFLEAEIRRAAAERDPAVLATALLKLAAAVHRFYHDLPVLTAEKNLARERLGLLSAAAEGIKIGAELLGIEVLEKM